MWQLFYSSWSALYPTCFYCKNFSRTLMTSRGLLWSDSQKGTRSSTNPSGATEWAFPSQHETICERFVKLIVILLWRLSNLNAGTTSAQSSLSYCVPFRRTYSSKKAFLNDLNKHGPVVLKAARAATEHRYRCFRMLCERLVLASSISVIIDSIASWSDEIWAEPN